MQMGLESSLQKHCWQNSTPRKPGHPKTLAERVGKRCKGNCRRRGGPAATRVRE